MAEQMKSSLYAKLALVAGAIEAVEKDGVGQAGNEKYRYATPASVMSAVKPLMAAQGLAIVPHLVEFQEVDTGQRSSGGKPFILNRVLMHYHILDGESGEAIVVPWQGQAGTYGDDKGLAKAQTIALRTFLIQLFQIPAEDPEVDPDARDSRPASYEKPSAPIRGKTPPAPPLGSPGLKTEPTRAELIDGVNTLWRREKAIDPHSVPPSDTIDDLETASIDRIKELGRNAKTRLAALRKQQEPIDE